MLIYLLYNNKILINLLTNLFHVFLTSCINCTYVLIIYIKNLQEMIAYVISIVSVTRALQQPMTFCAKIFFF